MIRNKEDGRYLLVQRDANCKYYPLQWSFPGEHSREGEDPGDAAVRGAEEELELSLSKETLVPLVEHTQPHAPGTTQAFLVDLPEDQTPVLKEGAALGWFTLEEIKGMSLGFGHQDLLQYLT